MAFDRYNIECWRPGLSKERLLARAQLLASIRSFFAERDVMEVDTPIVASAGVSDPHLSNATTRLSWGALRDTELYLQTSPEYAMKRLLAAGSGCIYQIAKVIRDDEIGKLHNPEFTLLEWYRVGFDDRMLIDEVDELLQRTLECRPAERISYQQLFIDQLAIDPLTKQGCEQLKSWLVAQDIGDWIASETDDDVLLQLAMSHFIEPNIGQDRPTVVYDFPASQAALARLDASNPEVARRFEVYFQGVELANGFYELTDHKEQAERFTLDNRLRAKLGKPKAVIDEKLLAALKSGLPDCAGVALGIDRLLMLKWQASDIDEVMPFSIRRI